MAMVVTDLETAELIKYAANSFLATKVSFINEMANLCEAFGADVQQVAKGIGLDGRIGRKFLHAGPGYGGSCFPKDTAALIRFAHDAGENMRIVSATAQVNNAQHERMVRKIESAVGNLRGKKIALLGLSFKPNTDDVRDSPALEIAKGLIRRGARVVAHDPVAMDNVARLPVGKKLEFAIDAYSAAEYSHAVVLATEWNQYRRLDLKRLAKQLRKPILIDLRNVYMPQDAVRAGLDYHSVGRPSQKGTVAERKPASPRKTVSPRRPVRAKKSASRATVKKSVSRATSSPATSPRSTKKKQVSAKMTRRSSSGSAKSGTQRASRRTRGRR